jgi:hypothetical protein
MLYIYLRSVACKLGYRGSVVYKLLKLVNKIDLVKVMRCPILVAT